MEIMYLKGTDMVTLSGVRVFHVSQGQHSFLYFSADGKDYTSDGSIHIEEEPDTALREEQCQEIAVLTESLAKAILEVNGNGSVAGGSGDKAFTGGSGHALCQKLAIAALAEEEPCDRE